MAEIAALALLARNDGKGNITLAMTGRESVEFSAQTFYVKQFVRRHIQSFAKKHNLVVIKFYFARFVVAVVGLIFFQFVSELLLRNIACFSCLSKISSDLLL